VDLLCTDAFLILETAITLHSIYATSFYTLEIKDPFKLCEEQTQQMKHCCFHKRITSVNETITHRRKLRCACLGLLLPEINDSHKCLTTGIWWPCGKALDSQSRDSWSGLCADSSAQTKACVEL